MSLKINAPIGVRLYKFAYNDFRSKKICSHFLYIYTSYM